MPVGNSMPLKAAKRPIWEGLAISIAAVILRIWFLAPYPTGWDDVDFALGLQQYDLSRMHPHFPGYPIYILTAHLFYAWLHDPFLALSALSATAGGLTVVPLWLLFRRMGSPRVARLAAWLYTIAPLPLVSSIQPMSDSFGAFLAAWLAYFTWRAGEVNEGICPHRSNTQLTGYFTWSAGEVNEGINSVSVDHGRHLSRQPSQPNNQPNREQRSDSSLYLILSGIVLGLLLGVRISYLALSALWIWAGLRVFQSPTLPTCRKIRTVATSVAAVAGICLSWTAAMVVSEGGFDSFLALAVSFTEGHFSDWGGTYQADSSFWERAGLLVFRQIGAAGLGTVWTDAAGWRWIPTVLLMLAGIGLWLGWRQMLPHRYRHSAQNEGFIEITRTTSVQNGSVIVGNRRVTSRQTVFLAVWLVPYLIWAFFAQNIEKPRHILPILPPLLFLLVSGIEQVVLAVTGRRKIAKEASSVDAQAGEQGVTDGLGGKTGIGIGRGRSGRRLDKRIFRFLSLLWLMGTAGVSYPLMQEAHSKQSPMMQLADYVKENIVPHDSLIFTWEEQRVLNYATPSYTVIRLRKWEDFQTEVLQYDKLPMKVFATNALIDGFHRPVNGLFQQVITFQGSPWLYPTYHTVVLYQGTASLYDQFQRGKEETTWKSKRY